MDTKVENLTSMPKMILAGGFPQKMHSLKLGTAINGIYEGLIIQKSHHVGAHMMALMFGGPPGSRTRHQRIMLTTMAFATPFGFVVWTVSCLYDLPVQSLHVLSDESFARDCHVAFATEVSPNLSSSTKGQS